MLRICKQSFLAILLLILPVLAWSQGATTSLRGTVTDASGAVIPSASVHLENKSTGVTSDTTTNGQGEYVFLQLAPGDYMVTVTATGFGKQAISAKLLVAQPATVNAKLTVGSDAITVEVASTTQVINTTDATIGNAIPTETIMALPSEGRRVEALMSLQPGVSYISDSSSSLESRNGTVSGARSDQTNLTLDGLDNNDQVFPAAFSGALRVPMDAVQEFRVTTSNANADTGRSSGGQANVVTRSGSNKLHGSLYEYNRNNWGQAAEWFTQKPLKLVRNTYGARLGGPVLRDKLFYFGNYEGQRTVEGQQYFRTVPSASLRAGTLRYQNTSGGVSTLSTGQIAALDSCTTTCPWGPGVNPNVSSLFSRYPAANSSLAGDTLNLGTLVFSSPSPTVLNTYLGRIDFAPSDRHRIFVRGLMMNDAVSSAEYYPGQGPYSKSTNNSKGLASGYTWSPLASLVNNLRFGYTRQSYATRGNSKGSYSTLRGIDPPEAISRTSTTTVPLYNLVDDFSYIKGRHVLQVGTNWRHFNYINGTDANSWDSSVANASYLSGSHIAGTNGPMDPGDVSTSYRTNYDYAATALLGLMTQTTNRYNYQVSANGSGATLLGTGATVNRNYQSNEFEWYVQDSYKPIPNLTLTFGVRHTILQTPWETNGQQVQPNTDLHQWFANRASGALQGQSIQPSFGFVASGKAHNGKPFYPMNWGNFAPRFAFAYSPVAEEGTWMHKLLGGAGKTSIRGGFGMYYDHFGQGVVTNFSRYGSFSLSTSLTNPASTYNVRTSPRFTGLHNIPAGINPTPASQVSYPQSLDPYSFAITYGLDDHLKTPYSNVVDFSIQRELKGGFTFEAAFVGRYGRHLMQASDLAQPLNLVDTKSGMDYYTAATMLGKAYDQGQTTVATIPYFENMFPNAKGVNVYGDGAPGRSATQNIYNDLWLGLGDPSQGLDGIGSRGNETNMIYFLDLYCYPGCINPNNTAFWPNQYSSLYAWSTIGTSSYNAGQFTLRHPMSHGVAMDFSYTLSKSQDMGSDTESNYALGGYVYGFILDAFHPRKNYAVSDFDSTHLLNADWVVELPFGHGRKFGGTSSRLVDAALGGWQLSGLARWSSGLPFGVADGQGWTTNWEWESYVVRTGPISTKKRYFTGTDGSLKVSAFGNAAQANNNIRLPYAGEAGQRNAFRGDGYFGIDAGLQKQFAVTDRLRATLAWETFNVTNSVRFDPHSMNQSSTDGDQIGVYTGALTSPRKMQFSGRIEF